MLRNDPKKLKSTLRVTPINFGQQHTVHRNVGLTTTSALFNSNRNSQDSSGWNMNKKVYFLSLTLLAIPGLVAASGYDLASPEYNLVANGLNSNLANETAIVAQQGYGNGANTQQDGNHQIAIVSQRGNGNQSDVSQSGGYNLAYVDQAGSSNDADISQSGYGNTGIIIQRGSGNHASISQQQSVGTKTVIVQNSSQMAVRVLTR
ncbi:minor curlin subunit [Scandinavium goeteborgense]|uniref:Minor curlin subunit n=2 Tax=Scandinavium goeteborgense TaxID=1851514 RepID=A0A4R6EXQ0_SCAGO|nr:curli minor subunit CsgB [Scandinavium goeteborgense]TDN64584.1 minor curlin subunit [Scandinavium goeteborgense]